MQPRGPDAPHTLNIAAPPRVCSSDCLYLEDTRPQTPPGQVCGNQLQTQVGGEKRGAAVPSQGGGSLWLRGQVVGGV